jgi:DNA-binding PadR family transcriptional regulator
MSLTAEQRQALELLASNPRGCTKGWLLADGFTVDILADLVREGLATAQRGTSRVGGRQIRVERYRITDDGRRALEG